VLLAAVDAVGRTRDQGVNTLRERVIRGGRDGILRSTLLRRGRDLAPGDLRQFRSETLARNAGAVASHHAVGVVVYQLKGEPEFDTWSEPKIIACYGETPEPT
jgi:hypothetical protein